MSPRESGTMTPPPAPRPDRPYPPEWDAVAEIRVFRAPHAEWDKLAVWNADMKKRGWQMLRVTHDAGQIIAIFGKARRSDTKLP